MKIDVDAQIVTAVSKPYDFNGNSGTSHKIRVNVGGEVYSCNSNADQVSSMKQYEGKNGKAVFDLSSPKENLKLSLISFVPGK